MDDAYHFVTNWRVKAQADEVFDIIGEPLDYPRWWPSVYLGAREIGTTAQPVGRRIEFHTRGWLPYTLRWEARTTEVDRPKRIVAEAFGDFNGRGEWTFVQDGDHVNITFDWRLTVAKPLLKYLTPVMRPAFEANHRWAMAQGETSLREELIRYRARTPQELRVARDPRGPVEVPVRWIAAGALAASAFAAIAIARRKSNRENKAPA